MATDDRGARGAEILAKIHADWGCPQVLGPLEQVAPDFVKMVRDFAFGEIYARPGLDLKSRQLVTVAALAAKGGADMELKAHLHGALKLGWKREELIEALMQIAVYAGFPTASQALLAAKEVFEERDAAEERPKSKDKTRKRGAQQDHRVV